MKHLQESYKPYVKELRGVSVKYLLPGESFEYGGEE